MHVRATDLQDASRLSEHRHRWLGRRHAPSAPARPAPILL